MEHVYLAEEPFKCFFKLNKFTRNRCIATSNKCVATSNRCILELEFKTSSAPLDLHTAIWHPTEVAVRSSVHVEEMFPPKKQYSI